MNDTNRLLGQSSANDWDERNHDQSSGIKNVQDLEKIINEGLRAALKEDTPDQSLEVFLEHLGKALNGQRTYIFEQNEYGCDDNTYEWVADGVEAEKDNLQNLPPEVCASWYENFSIGRHIVIANLEDIRETSPLQYEKLKQQNIHSLVVVPLYNGEKNIGFYGVDNPPVQSLEYASNMLQTAAYFIVSSLKQRNLFRELQKQNHTVFHALNVNYLGIYQINFDTGEYKVYRNSEQMSMDWSIHLKDGYQTAMERYITNYVVSNDQEHLRAMTQKDYVLSKLSAEKKYSVRYRVKNEESRLKYMEIYFSATEQADGKNCVIFAQRDVNDVVEQEEEYRLETRRSLEDILEGARIGIWTIELEEGCSPRMYADRTMRMLLGVSDDIKAEDCYLHWFNHINPDYVTMVQNAVNEIIETGRSEVTYPWHHPELGKIYVRCGGVVDKSYTNSGICLTGYHQDITEVMEARKKQEQAIMELLEKVRQANYTKTEFLSYMSHDLRTPINGILGMLDIMEKIPNDSKRQKECRDKIRISTKHLLSFLNDVLQVSNMDSGIHTEMAEPFDLHEVLDDCIAILSAQAADREIRLILEETDLHHSRLIGNSLHVEQILMNIIDNAIKYNKPQGSVFVYVQETSCDDGIAQYQFTIKDTGIGISEDFKKHIFDIFTQDNQGARTNYNGVGLGMTIVKKLVDQMGGSIEIDSQIGRGSSIQISLPIRIDETWNSKPVDEPYNLRSNIAGMRVLLVEDNEINCEILQFMLEDAGASVVIASNGKAAVETFAEAAPDSFDCILMDLMMPQMSGYEATRVIRSMDRTDADLPIIALSANAFEEDIAMAKEAGMNEHLPKPVDFRKLFRIMKRMKR